MSPRLRRLLHRPVGPSHNVADLETWFYVGATVNGFLILIDRQPKIPAMVVQYPAIVTEAYGIALFVSGVLCLIGALWPRRIHLDGDLTLRRTVAAVPAVLWQIGLITLAVACLTQVTAGLLVTREITTLTGFTGPLMIGLFLQGRRIGKALRERLRAET